MDAHGVVFSWSFDIACNFRCPYCYFDGRWEQLGRENQRRPLEEVLAAWEKVYDKHGECMIMFSGGEPTVYPRFDELLAGLSRRHRWVINTNLTWDEARWRDLASRLDPRRGDVYASFHPTEKMALDVFVRRSKVLRELGFSGDSTIVAYPPFLADLRRYHDVMKAAGLAVRPQPFVGHHEGREYPAAYTPEDRALIRELSGESSLLPELPFAIGRRSPLGRLCHAGQYYCMVNLGGNVYRCLQIGAQPAELLGNIFGTFELKAAPSPCPMSFCSCGESQWLVDNLPGHVGLAKPNDAGNVRVPWRLSEPDSEPHPTGRATAG